MVVKIKPGMTLFDAAVASGSMEAVFAMAALNGLSLTSALAVGVELQTTGLKYKASTLPVVAEVTSRPIIVLAGQTLPDIAIQQLGSLEAWFELARLNGMGITDALSAGGAVAYGVAPFDALVAALFANKGYKPQSGKNNYNQAMPELPDGIGFMVIQSTFKIA